MPEIPIEIINLNANAGFREGIINGNLEGQIKAGIAISADACHGISLGLKGDITGEILGNMDILFIGAQAKGEVQAAAGAQALIRLEPNLLEKMGLSIYVGAYARAMASGSLAIYLTPEFFAQQIQDHLDDFTSDLFLIFLEEVKAEMGVWGRIAYSAMAEANVNVVCDVKKLSAGFEISGGYKYGLKGGAGYDFYCDVGFKNLRRAVNRSSLRIVKEINKHLLKSSITHKQILAESLNFCFPLMALTAYDLGHKSAERGEFLNKEEVAAVLFTNFSANLQRYAVEKMTELAVKLMVREFSKIYYKVFSISLDEIEQQTLTNKLDNLIDTLEKGDLRLSDVNIFITETLNIIDILDGGALDDFKRPLTLFWASAVLGFALKELLGTYDASLGLGSSPIGEATASINYQNLPKAPDFIKEEMADTLGEAILKVDVRIAVDYLIEVGIPEAETYLFPEISSFKTYFESAFNLTFGQIFQDAFRGMKGEGSLGDYHSYQAIKQLVKEQLVDQLLMNELLTNFTNQIDDSLLSQYVEEVVRPSLFLSSEFLFTKLDDFLIEDLQNITNLPQFVNGISSGCGVVVYKILARNIAFFDQVVNDFILDFTFTGFDNLGVRLQNTQDPFFVSCKDLMIQSFPNLPHIEDNIEAARQLLLDLTYAFKEISGPTIFTAERRNNLRVLKRDILLSMAGEIDYTETPQAFVDRLLDCGFIPNLELVNAFGNQLFEINVEAFRVFTQKIIPAFNDFYLALALPALQDMKKALLEYIQDLLKAAEDALKAYNELSNAIDENILAFLESIDLLFSQFAQSLQDHLDTWGEAVKSSIHYDAIEGIKENFPPGAARNSAILTFENTTWPVETIILDTAIDAGTTALDKAIQDLVENVDTLTDIGEEMVQMKQSIEDTITEGLLGYVLNPIASTAERLINALLPDTMLSQIEEYLEARAEQKRLEQELLDEEQRLALLEAEKIKTQQAYQRHNFNPTVDLNILDPTPGFPFIYPREITLQMELENGNPDMVANPSSKRIQVHLNGNPVEIIPSDWSASAGGMRFEKTIGNAEDGLNILEISWIKGATEEDLIRHTIPFIVNTDADYKKANFDVTIESNPEGSDVDLEYVEMNYLGTEDLTAAEWLLQDKAGHKFYLPVFTIKSGDQLKIYTGGNPDNNQIEPNYNTKLLFMGRKKAVWNNEGDTLWLTDADHVLIYQHSYTSKNNNQ